MILKNLILLTPIYLSQIIVIEILHFKSMVDVAYRYDTQKLSFVYPKCHLTKEVGRGYFEWKTLLFSTELAFKPLIILSCLLQLKTHSLIFIMDGQDHTCEKKKKEYNFLPRRCVSCYCPFEFSFN